MKGIPDRFLPMIRQCRLFSDLEDGELEQALLQMEARYSRVEKGTILKRAMEPLLCFGLVLSGAVQPCTDDREGRRTIMAHVSPGRTFGESLSFLRVQDSPVYILAAEDSEILWLSIHSLEDGRLGRKLAGRYTAMLAERSLAMNERIQILSKHTLREKLAAFLDNASQRSRNGFFTVDMTREDLAVYIGANRAAVSRELSRMKEEGLLDYQGRTFHYPRSRENE